MAPSLPGIVGTPQTLMTAGHILECSQPTRNSQKPPGTKNSQLRALSLSDNLWNVLDVTTGWLRLCSFWEEIPVPPLGFLRIYLLQSLKHKNSQTGQTFPTESAPKGFGHKNLLPLILTGRGKSLQLFVWLWKFLGPAGAALP